jgi:alkaline phosphatase D
MKFDRRQALGLLGAGTATASCATAPALPPAQFLHGVASGDPLADRVIIWTAVSGPDSAGRSLKWAVAEDAGFSRIVKKGSVRTGDAGTAKVDVGGLQPNREYWYRFSDATGSQSPAGRAQTLPSGPTADVVLAVATCALWPGGFFNAYEAIAKLPEDKEKDSKKAEIQKMADQKHNAAVEADEQVAGRFNEQLKAYNAKAKDKK